MIAPVELVRETSAPASSEIPESANSHRSRLLIVALLVAPALAVAVAVAVTMAWVFFARGPEGSAPDTRDRVSSPASKSLRRIVVLPFQDLGDSDSQSAGFSTGLKEEIMGRLAGSRNLRVIARGSSLPFDAANPDYRRLRKELRADLVLSGTVRWARNDQGRLRVRVTPKLTRTEDGIVRWAANYDHQPVDVIGVQIGIASAIFHELGISLDDDERRVLEDPPTDSIPAYRAFLQGLQFARDPDVSEANLSRAVSLFERALEFDDGFGRAWAELSIVLSYGDWLGYELAADSQLDHAREAAEKALALAPQMPYTDLAMGYYSYYGSRDYSASLDSFRRAEEGLPGDAETAAAIGWVLRRLGRFEEALEPLERSLDLDPISAWLTREVGVTYRMLRRYDTAATLFDRAIELAPDQDIGYFDAALNQLLSTGDVEKARLMLPEDSEHPTVIYGACWLNLLARDAQAAKECADRFDQPLIPNSWPRSLFEGRAYRLSDETEKAHAAFSRVVTSLQGSGSEYRSGFALGSTVRHLASERCNLAVALAQLGRHVEAKQQMEVAIRELPVSKDALWGSDRMIYQAEVLALIGKRQEAMEVITDLLSRPSDTSLALLEIDPRWDGLRRTREYEALLAERSEE